MGIVTAVACALCCVAEVGFATTAATFDASGLILTLSVAVALALLGPGAYSMDARIFGRRVIDLPPPRRRIPH